VSTRFVELTPDGPSARPGVLVIPGAAWGASRLAPACGGLLAAGCSVVLCDPRGTPQNPGAYTHAELDDALDARLARWSKEHIVVVAHSMGARAAARLAARDARVVQIWVAPVIDSAACFAHLYEGPALDELLELLFATPRTAAEVRACAALSTRAWLDGATFSRIETLALPSRGAARVPDVSSFLRELAHPGYRLAPREVRGLREIWVPRGDAWVSAESLEAFGTAAGVPVASLRPGLGHAVGSGWPEVLERVARLDSK